MKTKFFTIITTILVSSSISSYAGNPKAQSAPSNPKPNVFCYVPLLKSTTLCNTYNGQMSRQLAPQVPVYRGYGR